MDGLDGWIVLGGAGVGVKGPHGQVGNPPRVLMIYTYRTPQYQSSISTLFRTLPHTGQPPSACFDLLEVIQAAGSGKHALHMLAANVFNSDVNAAHGERSH